MVKNICHTGHVPLESYSMSSRYLDGTILMYLKRNGGRIAQNKPADGEEEYLNQDDDDDGFTGAFVKEPIPGLYHWVYDLDLTSMYPNNIISLNISPETKVAAIDRVDYIPDARPDKRNAVLSEIEEMDKKTKDKYWSDSAGMEKYIQRRCVEFDMEFHVRGKLETYRLGQTPYTKEEFMSLITNSKYSISSNGILYRTDKKGVIPEILTKWFNDRKEMRRKAAECRKKGDMVGYNFYNQRQQVQKILLNSVYGCLGLSIFRWYDLDNALAVTASGISIIKTTAKAINLYYKQALGVEKDGDWVIYIDTDSCFVDAIPIIKKRFPNIDFNDDTAMTTAIMSVTAEVQSYVNNFYNVMAQRFFNISSHTFDAKQEVIAKTALWLAKKRYAQWIIHKEGALLEEPEMEVKGIDVVRTSFPAAFRKFMEGFLRGVLTNVPKDNLDASLLKFRNDMKDYKVIDIAKNTSVKFISDDGDKNYNPESRKPFQYILGTPAQVKAGLNYNDFLNKLGLEKEYEQIHDRQKIKWVYLTENPLGFDSMAMKGDGNDPDKIISFIEKYVDRKAMFEKELKSKLVNPKKEGLYDVMRWQFPNSSMTTSSQFFA